MTTLMTLALAAALAAPLGSIRALAQPPQREQVPGPARVDPSARSLRPRWLWKIGALRRRAMLRRVARALGLTPQQRQQIRKVMQDARSQRRSIRANAALTPGQKRERLAALRGQVRRAIQGILTQDQKARLRAIRRRIAMRLGHRGLLLGRQSPM